MPFGSFESCSDRFHPVVVVLERLRSSGRRSGEKGTAAFRRQWPGVTVLDPWYRSLDFLSVIGTAIVILAMLANVFRKRHTSTHTRTFLENTLAERTRAARDYNNSFLHTGETERPSAESAGLQINETLHLQSTLHQFSALLGRPLDEDADTETDGTSEPLDVTFIVVGHRREMNSQSRRDIYRIGSEAIRDAFLEPKASKLMIELIFDRDFCLRVLHQDGDRTAPDSNQHRSAPLVQPVNGQAALTDATLSSSYTVSSSGEIQLLVPGHRAYAQASGAGPQQL